MSRRRMNICWQRGAGLICLALAVAPVSAARAQDAQGPATEAVAEADPAATAAREHFQKGVDYYTEGDLTAAMVEFQRAYKLQPTYRLLYNLGQVAYEQRDYAAAERYFRTYLAEGGDDIQEARRHEVQRELERLQSRVADVRIASSLPSARLYVDEQPVGTAPLARPVRVSAGRRAIRAELPGYAPVRKVVDVVGGEPLSVELTFGAPLAQVAESPSADSGTSPALWTGIATGVLALGTGGMALWTNSEESNFDDALARATSPKELENLRDSTEQKALITDILLGATVVTATITLILLLTEDGPAERRPDTARVEVGPGSVRASF